jgi:hypothetical protein
VIPSITALSQYLLEDLYEYFKIFATETSNRLEQISFSCHGPFGVPGHGNDLVPKSEVGSDSAHTGPEPGPESLFGPGSGSQQRRMPLPGEIVAFIESLAEKANDSETADVAPVAALSLVRSLTKKFRDRVSTEADAVAEAKFLRSNDLCKNWRLELSSSWDEELYGNFLSEVDNFLHPEGQLLVGSVAEIFGNGRCGPGASLGANGCDFYTKLYSSRLTSTSYEVYYQYAEHCAKLPIWREAEINRLIAYGLPNIVRESIVTFVQKDLTQTRSICTEPSLNMFFQLGLGEILSSRLKTYFGIDLKVQARRNVRLARRGSIDGSISTIDLESASDSVSLGLCDLVFPEWFSDLLRLYRTPFTKIRGKTVELEMVSTMGNGFTFPLQTAIFCCVVKAVARSFGDESGRANARGARWGVFGDDIICPSNWADRVQHLLRLLGFRVNGNKSYTNVYGRFRESCGGDYFRGHNVRGVYIKRLDTLQSRYVAINLLNEWSARWGITLPRCIGYLQDTVRLLAVPACAPVDSGIRVPSSMKSAWGWTAFSKQTYSFLYKCYEPDPHHIVFKDNRITATKYLRQLLRLKYNPDGLYMAFLGGYIEGSGTNYVRKRNIDGQIAIALKQGESGRYRTRLRVSPFWDASVEQVGLHQPGFWEWWNTTTEMNLRSFSPGV